MGDDSKGDRDPASGHFLPGHAGSGGRPRSIAKQIVEMDGGDPTKTARFFIALRDNDKKHLGIKRDAPLRERRAAAEWLGDHQHGKAPQPITGAGGEGPVQVEVTTLLQRLEKLARDGQGESK